MYSPSSLPCSLPFSPCTLLPFVAICPSCYSLTPHSHSPSLMHPHTPPCTLILTRALHQHPALCTTHMHIPSSTHTSLGHHHTHPHTVYYSEFALLLLGIPGHFLVVWYLWTGRGSVFNMKLWMVLSLFLPNSALAYVSTSPHSLTLAGVAVSGLALTAAQTPK